jgi:hypothetical protein
VKDCGLNVPLATYYENLIVDKESRKDPYSLMFN